MGDDVKKPEQVPLQDMNDEKETTEKSPLKEDAEGGKPNGKELEAEGGQGSPLLGNSKVKALLLAALALLIIILFLAIVFITVRESETDLHDPAHRYLKLIPSPDGGRNTITFRSGHDNEGGGFRGKVAQMNRFLEDYSSNKIIGNKFNLSVCTNAGENEPPADMSACFWDISPITSICSKEQDFGYPDGTPCIFLVFDKDPNLEAEPMDAEELANSTIIAKNLYRPDKTYIFVECEGNTQLDREYLGTIRYAPPKQELPMGFFPYTGHPHYVAPFIAIKLAPVQKGVAIGITCKMYARNLTDHTDSAPSVLPFNILIQ